MSERRCHRAKSQEMEPQRQKHRNQTVRNKFFTEKKEIRETHPHIVAWFDSGGSRAVQTDIIENCFKKEGKTWKLDLDKPFFQESKKRCVGSRGAYINL